MRLDDEVGAQEVEEADEQGAPPLTPEDVALIKRNVSDMYSGADVQSAAAGIKEVHARYPHRLINALHRAKAESGDCEFLDRPPAKQGAPIKMPQVEQSDIAFGLVSVQVLDDGRFARTELTLDELGEHAAVAVEYGALQQAYADAVRRQRLESR